MRDRGAYIAAKHKRRTIRAKRTTKEQKVACLEYHRRLMDLGVRNWNLMMLMKAKGEDKALAVMIEALRA